MTFSELATYLDRHLRIDEIPDYPSALNGVQAERRREVEVARVAFAVDASEASILEAGSRGADLLIVHHGLFWGGVQSLTGSHYRRVRGLIESDLGLYSAHLPLDVHPDHGNNAVLAREIGLTLEGNFGDYKGLQIGVWGSLDIRREALAARLDEILGNRVRLIPGGPERLRRIGIVTGGGGSQIDEARRAGLDAFITGEVAHHNYFDATEGGINLYLGGHYATEVWGLRSLSAHLAATLRVETIFLDHPTGL